jgi:hypothetical protein
MTLSGSLWESEEDVIAEGVEADVDSEEEAIVAVLLTGGSGGSGMVGISCSQMEVDEMTRTGMNGDTRGEYMTAEKAANRREWNNTQLQ